MKNREIDVSASVVTGNCFSRVLRLAREHWLFLLFLSCMLAYYIVSACFVIPHRDEAYTYLAFIHSGFLYSITHWPFPNNHVLFSALSSLVDIGPYFALRFVSVLSVCGTLIVLYVLLGRISSKNVSLLSLCAYVSLGLAHTVSFRGRGYSLSILFMSLLLLACHDVVSGKAKRWQWVAIALCLWGGLYTVMSSLYWCVAIPMVTFLSLATRRDWRNVFKFVLSGFFAGVMTVLSYGVIWIWTGAHFVGGQAGSHMTVRDAAATFLSSPLSCVRAGFVDMVTNPSLHGESNFSTFASKLGSFMHQLFSAMVNSPDTFCDLTSCELFVVVLLSFAFAFSCWRILRKGSLTDASMFPLYCSVMGVLIFALMINVQHAFPFVRCLAFLCVYVAIMIAYVLRSMVPKKRWLVAICLLANGFAVAINVSYFGGDFVNDSWRITDHLAAELNDHIPMEAPYVCEDQYAELQLSFQRCGVKTSEKDSDSRSSYVVRCKTKNEGGYPYLRTRDEVNGLIAEKHMRCVFENARYELFSD